ncbi:transposase [Candidatus Synechococcus calcipolaris G9]|uniref:Transposase n=1 Tax=Candidatus Synechococcus calcipolaris G9 TaxID=1497997 RepID=A0ABT6F2B0_9SYNE|nr:transposase [Candidatus Synechococcus calcipolaris]MDG2991967.1 transposase [Candidatus Synechococcus calcipolaris G9]
MKEKVQMSQKPRRTYTAEQKVEAVAIVKQSGKPISQVAQEMGLTESALRQWVKKQRLTKSVATKGHRLEHSKLNPSHDHK